MPGNRLSGIVVFYMSGQLLCMTEYIRMKQSYCLHSHTAILLHSYTPKKPFTYASLLTP